MTYAYIRVSTGHQSTENQRIEIERFCKNNMIKVDKWIDETISGIKTPDTRKLGELMQSVQKDDLVLCTELSRLGRSLIMIMNITIFFRQKCKSVDNKRRIQTWR